MEHLHRQELVSLFHCRLHASLIVCAEQVRLLLQTHRLQPQVGNRGREGLPDIRLLSHLCLQVQNCIAMLLMLAASSRWLWDGGTAKLSPPVALCRASV